MKIKYEWKCDCSFLNWRVKKSSVILQFLILLSPWTYSPWNSPGQNTGVHSHSLLQGIFLTQRLNWSHTLHADSFLPEPPGSLFFCQGIWKDIEFMDVVVVVMKWCLPLCNPMDCSMTSFPVPHYLPEFAQAHVHWVSDMEPRSS